MHVRRARARGAAAPAADTELALPAAPRAVPRLAARAEALIAARFHAPIACRLIKAGIGSFAADARGGAERPPLPAPVVRTLPRLDASAYARAWPGRDVGR